MIYRFEPFELNARTSELQPVPYFVVSRTVCIPLRPGENGGAKLDHRAANRSCFWAE